MPLAEVRSVRGSLSENQIKVLAGRLTEVFMQHQGARPGSAAAAGITCVEFTEMDESLCFVAGEPVVGPRIRVVYTVPTGSLNEEAKSSLVSTTTRMLLELQGRDDEEPYDIWCIVNEIPDGNWGAAGRIFRWRDITRWVARRDIAARKLERDHAAS